MSQQTVSSQQAAGVLEAAKKEVQRLRDELKKAGGAAAQLAEARQQLDQLSRGVGQATEHLGRAMERLDGFVEALDELDPAGLDETMLSVADRVSRIEENVRRMEQLSLEEIRRQKDSLDEISDAMEARLKESETRTAQVLEKLADSVRATHDQAMQQWDALEGRDRELTGQLEATRKLITALGVFMAVLVIWVLIF